MTLPVQQEGSAEQVLGTTSLEMIRGRVLCNVYDNPDLSWAQQKKIIKELDYLIENEKCRRADLAVRQWQREELEHRLVLAQKQAEIYQKYADIIGKLRLHKAETNKAIALYERDSLMYKVDVIERLIQIKAKYKPVEKQDDHLKELLQIKKKQKLSEAREQVILDSITKKALSRASFIKMVNEKFPDMVDELIDFYDQQIFRQGTRR